MISGRDPKCTLCKLHATAEFVCLLGEGPVPNEVMIIGEAPGKREDDSGKPFVGESGRLLLDTLEDMTGWTREDVFITNAVSCRPPQNRTPSKSEIKSCKKWLDYQIARVKPKYVLLLGNVPLMSVTGKGGIKKARGKPIEKDGIIFFPTYHPAYILRDPGVATIWERDLTTFKQIVDFGGIPEERELDYTIVDTLPLVEAMLNDLTGCVSSDLETNGLYAWADDAAIVSIGFGTRNKQWILPATGAGVWSDAQLTKIIARITERLKDCILVGHNWKFDAIWMKVHFGVDWVADFDTMLAHYLLDENDFHGLKYLAQKFLGAPNWDLNEEEKKTWSAKNAKYHAHDLYYTRKLKFYLQRWMTRELDVRRVFEHIMMPCVKLFTDAEVRGVFINIEKMADAEKYLRGEMAVREKELSKYGKINWGSPQQIAKLFFEDLKIKVVEKTAKGKPSTKESVLKQVDHPAVAALLKYRAAKQQLSFFIEGWKPFLVGSRLHPSFKLLGTVTGRLSCENPNLQQVPRDPRIRTLITAPKGYDLIEADLSQIELRIAAELSGERNMIHAFRTGLDVHWLTLMREIGRSGGQAEKVIAAGSHIAGHKLKYSAAIEVLLKEMDKCLEFDPEWKELRKKAKAINFGYLYGMWWKKFKMYARDNYDIIVTDEEAQQSRIAYFELYPDLEPWHDKQKAFAREFGYVESLSGRRRRLPDAMLPHDTPARREAERQAINSPVQSFANELNLMAALQICEEYRPPILYPVGTIHDAVLLECRKDKTAEVTKRLLKIMQRPKLMDLFEIDFDVPIEAEAKIGPWGGGKEYHKWLATLS